jgi:hypothetical protein
MPPEVCHGRTSVLRSSICSSPFKSRQHARFASADGAPRYNLQPENGRASTKIPAETATPALRDSAAASLTSDCGSSWPQSCGGELTRDYFLSVFGRGRCRNRTPGPPPLSSMNSTPAASSARRTAKSLATVSEVLSSASSARLIVLSPSDDSRARSPALHLRRARAARI